MQYCAWCGSPVETISYALCRQCGKPTNGAPPQSAAPAKTGGGSNTAVIIIIVVVVVLLIVAFIGIVAAIAIPNMLVAQSRARQRRTMADLRAIVIAVESYGADNDRYPQSLDELSPKYIRAVPRADGWGHRYEYQGIKDEKGPCGSYVLFSAGRDGVREPSPAPGPTHNFDCDIVFSNGQFTEYPEGVQR